MFGTKGTPARSGQERLRHRSPPILAGPLTRHPYVCVRACVRACLRVCVRACARVYVHARVVRKCMSFAGQRRPAHLPPGPRLRGQARRCAGPSPKAGPGGQAGPRLP